MDRPTTRSSDEAAAPPPARARAARGHLPKRRRTAAAASMVVALLVGLVATASPAVATVFPDVPPGHPFATPIGWAVDTGVTNGFDDGTFRPTVPVSRQAFAAFLARYDDGASGSEPAACTGDGPFDDVPASHPFCAEIAWLVDLGVTTGFDDNTFRPTNAISRQAMAAFLARYASDSEPAACTGDGPFADVPASHPFCAEITWMVDEAITTGFDDNTFRPTNAITRQAAAAFLWRLAGEPTDPIEPVDPGMPADGVIQTIAVSGSDTTEGVMGAVVDEFNSSNTPDDWNEDPDLLVNIGAPQITPLIVPGDANCETLTYAVPAGPGQVLAPNGSGAGRNALRISVDNGDGCIDIARSSAPPRAVSGSGDRATFEYYAFGLDAVGWASASTAAPSNLTLTQLRGIYNCTLTNFNEVGGSNQQIQRYIPQAGSGTRAFFLEDVLGFNPESFSGPDCPAVKLTQENTGVDIAANGDNQSAISPYSMANWIAQARGTESDVRSGHSLGSLNGQSLVVFPGGVPTPNTAGPVAEENVRLNDPNPPYPGVRYVFNVVDREHVNYLAAKRFVGFENKLPDDGGSNSPLCRGDLADIIEDYGFGTLPTTESARNLPGGTCRLYTP